MGIKRVLQFVLGIVTLTIIVQLVLYTNLPRGTQIRNRDNLFCDAIHVGFLHVTTSAQLYKTLKFLVFYRNSPLHIHFFVNETGAKIVNALFETWHIPQVKINTYKLKDLQSSDTIDEKLQSLQHPALLDHTDRLIVMEPNLLVMGDLQPLWNLFNHFQGSQVLGAVRRSDSKMETDIFLLDLHKLLSMSGPLNSAIGVHFAALNPQYLRWTHLENIVDKDELNSVKATLLNMGEGIPPRRISRCPDLHELKNSTDAPTVSACSMYPDSQTFKRRTLLLIRHFRYAPKEHDVTLVTQLPYEKLEVFEAMCRRWLGPISATVYLSEVDLEKTIDSIEKSSVLKHRYNIAYHVVIKRGEFHPVNYLRNVALRNVITSHVFLIDIDFLPSVILHKTLLPYLAKVTHNKALVIPAFATNQSNAVIPFTVDQLKSSWDKKIIIPLPEKTLGSDHLPADYKRLRNATEPYKIQWKPNHEPYIVVQSNVVEYDERFFGYAHDKISHILELHAQNYEFIVLPNTFVVHKGHVYETFPKDDYDRSCLQTIIEQNVNDLNRKYGTKYNITNLYGVPTKLSLVKNK